MQIFNLWHSTDPRAWQTALDRYWNFVQPRNLALERALDALDLDRLKRLDASGWYDFLLDEYFRWKYTAPNRYATTAAVLKCFVDENGLGHLDQLRSRLLTLDTTDVRSALKVACEIPGLGTAGASGLLALMYPRDFGTVDHFVVNALRQVDGLPEAQAITRMNPGGLTIRDGVILIDILHRKAADNNRVFKSAEWTPRKMDKVLWTCGR